jgi:NADH-quinone oxidoreductase subunit J
MSISFLILGGCTLLFALAAMSLRNLVHCALFAALSLAGLAAVYLQLDAQFVGLSQVLVYVGAVAILIVFAILLTRGSEPTTQPILSRGWWLGILVAAIVWLSLAAAVLLSPLPQAVAKTKSEIVEVVAVRHIGTQLMTEEVLPLEILALLLTGATMGAVIIAMQEKPASK